MGFILRVMGSLSVLLLSSISISSLQAATIHVVQTVDSFDAGACSLRDAIQSMNVGSDSGGCVNSSPDAYGVNNTITLDAQTYVLSLPGAGEDMNATGDLDIKSAV